MELHMVNDIIQRLDMAQESRQLWAEELQLQKDLKLRVLGLAAIERSRWRQASHLVWLKEGDARTRFFHLRENSRARKSYIPCLKNAVGNYVWSHQVKEEVLHGHFQQR
jgi:hypothetical protein